MKSRENRKQNGVQSREDRFEDVRISISLHMIEKAIQNIIKVYDKSKKDNKKKE